MLLTVVSEDKSLPEFIFGSNHLDYNSSHHIISTSSCTAACLAPLIKALHEGFGIEAATYNSTHPLTMSQATVDSSNNSNRRMGRSGLNNIVPKTQSSCDAVAEMFGFTLKGITMRAPSQSVASIDLTFLSKKPATYEELMAELKRRTQSDLKGALGFTQDEVVSSDFRGSDISCIVDSLAGHSVNPHFHKVVGWYDNEWGYTTRVSDMVVHMAKVDGNVK